MTENVRKLVGVVVVAVLVVVGVVTTSGGDDVDFTRNAAFLRMPKAQQARLAPAFVEQAAPKSLDTGPINKINKEGGPIFKGATGYKLKNVIVTSLEASVLEGRGVDGKGGTSSIRLGGGVDGKTGKAGIWSTGGVDALSGRKASIRLGTGVNGVADRIEKWNDCSDADNLTVNSLKDVLVTSYTDSGRITYSGNDEKGSICLPTGPSASGGQDGEGMLHDTAMAILLEKQAELLAECMDSKVGDVFLKSHIKSSATDCIATVLPTALPDRAKQLGTYWQTQQQITAAEGESG